MYLLNEVTLGKDPIKGVVLPLKPVNFKVANIKLRDGKRHENKKANK